MSAALCTNSRFCKYISHEQLAPTIKRSRLCRAVRGSSSSPGAEEGSNSERSPTCCLRWETTALGLQSIPSFCSSPLGWVSVARHETGDATALEPAPGWYLSTQQRGAAQGGGTHCSSAPVTPWGQGEVILRVQEILCCEIEAGSRCAWKAPSPAQQPFLSLTKCTCNYFSFPSFLTLLAFFSSFILHNSI